MANTNDRLASMLPQSIMRSLKPRTLVIWSAVYSHLEDHNQIDIDSMFFLEGLADEHGISVKTIKNHIRRMWKANLLDAHDVRRRTTKFQRWTMRGLFLPPTSSIFYTLPGVELKGVKKRDADIASTFHNKKVGG